MYVPEVTAEQKQASAAVKKAQEAAAAASNIAAQVATEAAVLKKLADDYATVKLDADRDAWNAKSAVDDAIAAKRNADEKAVVMLENKRKQEKKFLQNAFAHFDTDNAGLITTSQLQTILADLKLPSNSEDVDLLDGIRDKHGWVAHMPVELKEALMTHSQAGAWGVPSE